MPIAALLCGAVLLVQQPAQDPPASPVDAYLRQARDELSRGEHEAAVASVARALERDDRHLAALRLRAEIAEAAGDTDTAVYTWHRWLEVQATGGRRAATKERRDLAQHLAELDTESESWARLVLRYVRGLESIGREYLKRKDWLGALEAHTHWLQVDPESAASRNAIRDIRRKGGREVAVDDVFAGGGDPTEGRSREEIEAEDRRHTDWSDAYTEDGENYRYRTNAGWLVLKTSSIAMEQMNRFYRRFFHFKEDGGKTPKIEVRVFKSRDDYLELGSNPVSWSAGQFTGSAVETYVGGVTGKESIRDMYRVLFHEAAHQFVSLTGAFVPGWLNEAYASFFEGCVILSNGTVKWNLPPPGRLFPLANRLERGYMTSHDEARPGPDGEWVTPETAPPFAMVISGGYRWGPPWYAPTWGVVYFLYNYRTDDGLPVYREALHAYYQSFKRGRANDPIAHFEETVLAASPLSPVKAVAELEPIWKEWILALRDRESGKTSGGDELLRWADAALGRGDKRLALEFLDEAREDRPDDVELTWRVAELLEDLGERPLAAARYREFRRAIELADATGDPRYEQARVKVERLDPLTHRYRAIKNELGEAGIALAKGYEERGLPTMALEIARRMSANFSIPAALEYYVDLARRTGRTLARWRVAYNERDLDGWSGNADSYQAYGRRLRADVPADPARDGLQTRQLVCDVTFDGDFSLEAQMRIEQEGDGWAGRLCGLCFGVKGDQDFHAVMLHPKGFMDIASNRGGEWTIHDHRSAGVGSEWRTLRIDVAGDQLDVYLDGLYVRSLTFPSAAAIRGGFGLITGEGRATYRDIRILARERFDPAAVIERQLAMERVAADASLRQAGSFAGFAPPELRVAHWFQGEPTTLADLRGRPVLLAFWTPKAEKVIPCAAYLSHLIERGRAAGLETILVCDSGITPGDLDDFLSGRPIAGARIAIDQVGAATLDAYFVKAGHYGMPRILLIERDGKVTFEGDPGIAAGRGWQPGDGPTYVEDAFVRLLGK